MASGALDRLLVEDEIFLECVLIRVRKMFAEIVVDPSTVTSHFVAMLQQELHPEARFLILLEVQPFPILEFIYVGTGSEIGRKRAILKNPSLAERRHGLECGGSVNVPI